MMRVSFIYMILTLMACGSAPVPSTEGEKEEVVDTNTFCTVTEEEDGSATISCPDGSEVNIENNNIPEFTDDVYHGGFTVYSDFDAWVISHYRVVDGYLDIRANAQLEKLEEVKDLFIQGKQVSEISIPNLKTVEYDITIVNTSLTELNFGNPTVGENISVQNNAELPSCDVQEWFDSLDVHGDVLEFNNAPCP